MERELWLVLYHLAKRLDRRCYWLEQGTDAEIVAVLHDRPVVWATQAANWPPGLWPKDRLPSQSTLSRRLRTVEVCQLLHWMEGHLRTLWPRSRLVRILDSKPLVGGGFSKDPDSAWRRAAKNYARGSKCLALYDRGPIPEAWVVVPLNQADSEVAIWLLPWMKRGGYLVGNGQMDTSPLYEAAWARGCQLVAKRKRPRAELGHRRHGAARLCLIQLLQSEFGKALYAERGRIERQFGWFTSHAAGLLPLPSWVRRQDRVRLWVQAKLIIHTVYAYLYHPSDLPALRKGASPDRSGGRSAQPAPSEGAQGESRCVWFGMLSLLANRRKNLGKIPPRKLSEHRQLGAINHDTSFRSTGPVVLC